MERKTGLEPATPTLARLCSTTELLPHLLATMLFYHCFRRLSSHFLKFYFSVIWPSTSRPILYHIVTFLSTGSFESVKISFPVFGLPPCDENDYSSFFFFWQAPFYKLFKKSIKIHRHPWAMPVRSVRSPINPILRSCQRPSCACWKQTLPGPWNIPDIPPGYYRLSAFQRWNCHRQCGP